MQEAESAVSLLFELYNRVRTNRVLIFDSKLMFMSSSTFVSILIDDKSNIAAEFRYCDVLDVNIKRGKEYSTIIFKLTDKDGAVAQREIPYKSRDKELAQKIMDFVKEKLKKILEAKTSRIFSFYLRRMSFNANPISKIISERMRLNAKNTSR
jgi:hypothetical protein